MFPSFIDEAGNLRDFFASISGQFICSFHRLGAFSARHIRTGGIDGSHENRGWGSGVKNVQALLDISAAEHRRVGQKNRALSQTAARFVEGSRSHIGSSRHSRKGAVFILEVIMRAMGFVAKDGHVVSMSKFDNVFQRSDRTKVSRVDDKNGFSGGVTQNSPLPIIQRWLVRNL